MNLDSTVGQELGRVAQYRIERLARLRALPTIEVPPREGWITSVLLVEDIERACQSLEECKQKYPGRYRIVKVETIETVVEDSINAT